jgi:hypothetical protein
MAARRRAVASSKLAILHYFPFEPFSHVETSIKRRGAGSLILPIYCLFLLLLKGSLAHRELRGYPGCRNSETVTIKNTSKTAAPLLDQAHKRRAELARKIAFFVGPAERRVTDVPGLTLGGGPR